MIFNLPALVERCRVGIVHTLEGYAMTQQKVAAIGALGLMNGWFAKYLVADEGPIRFVRVADSTKDDPFQAAARERWTRYGATIVPQTDYQALIGDGVSGVTICTGKNAACIAVLRAVVPLLERTRGAIAPWILDFSTISPRCAREAAKFCAAHGVTWAGAPLTGGPVGAESAKMLILYGGPESLYRELETPFLSRVGVPRNCGSAPDAGAAIKMIGQTMVFGSLQAICGAAAMDTMCNRGGILGTPGQVDLLKFLNGGAGGMRQLDVALLIGLADGVWTKRGFLNKHAVIDALYAAQYAAELGLSRHGVINPLLTTAAALGWVATEHGPESATHAHVRNLFGEGAKRLDMHIDNLGYLLRPDIERAISLVHVWLPPSISRTAVLDVNESSFS